MATPNYLWAAGRDAVQYGRQNSGYATVDKGNVAPGEIAVTDPGQIGQGNVPGLHDSNAPAGDSRGSVAMPNVDAMLTRDNRWSYRYVMGRWTPNLIRGLHEEHATEGGTYPNHGQNPWGVAGSPEHNLETQEHGPFGMGEIENLAQIRQPKSGRKWWDRFKTAAKPKDDLGVYPEDVVAAVGRILPDDETYRPTDSAVGTGNTIVVPDVRRTWDHPKDAQGTIRDSDGNVVVDKAGYPLTNTAAEPIPWDVRTDHAYDVAGEVDINAISSDRVRAGVAGLDEGRPATMPHWFYMAPFDKLAADHPYGVKGQLIQPLASRPIYTTYEDVQDDGVTAGGARYYAPAAGMEAAGIQPNLDRQVPSPWDRNLYANGSDDNGMQHMATAANKGWGAR